MESLQVPPRKNYSENWGAYCQRVLDVLGIDEITPKELGALIGKSAVKAGSLLRTEMQGWKRSRKYNDPAYRREEVLVQWFL